MIPAQPPMSLFPWETQPSTGEGSAGRYLDHLQKEKKNRMKASIDLTIKAETIGQLVHALLDLKDYNGINIVLRNIEDDSVVAQPKIGTQSGRIDCSVPNLSRPFVERSYMTSKQSIRAYLDHICRLPESVQRPTVRIEYVAEQTNERTVRDAVPIRIEHRSQDHYPYAERPYLILKDVRKDAIRSFLMDNIKSVDGPTL